MKKSKILKYLLLIVPFLITIGFSTWVIIYEFNFGANKHETTLSSLFGTEQEGIYCAEELLPKQLNGDPIKESSLSYQHKAYGADDSTYDAGGPIDVGVYNIKITVANEDGSSEDCIIKYTVNQRKLSTNVIELDYKSGTTFDSIYLPDYIKFYDSNNNIDSLLSEFQYELLVMHNGVYYYGDLDEIYDVSDKSKLSSPSDSGSNIVGSTYLMYINLKDSNFLIKDCISGEYVDNPRVMFKYKTVQAILGGSTTLLTIEDAILKTTSDMTLLGLDTSDNTFIETSFSKILSTNSYSISSKRKIRLPYTSNDKDYDTVYQNKLTGLYSTLLIPSGINITLESNSNSSIVVGSVIDASGTVARHSVIMNHGTITVSNTCKIGAYGFIKGTGLINVLSGGEVIDVFRLYDWPGADEAINLKDASAFPVKEWSVYNISCKTRIYNGGLYNSVSYVVAVRGLVKLPINDIYIVGNKETENCLFKPGDSATPNDYIEKSATILNDSYIVTNQSKTVQNSVLIFGDYKDDNVRVNASGYAFETSTSIAIPLSYYDITIANNSKLILSAASYIFMNKSSVINVLENAELSINGDSFVAMLNQSSLNMNGTGANLSGTGTFAGAINCGQEKTILRIKNYDKYTSDANPIILKTSATATASYECLSSGNIKVNGEYKTGQSFTDSFLYISEKYGDSYYYVGASEDEYISYEIIYHTNGGEELEKDIIPSFDSTYTITVDMLKSPYRKYFELENWYCSNDFTTENIFKSATLNSTNKVLNVYVNWKYQKYKFSYAVVYEDPITKELITLNIDEILTDIYNDEFTYETLKNENLKVTTKANYNNKVFYGWFLGMSNDGDYVGETFTLNHLDQHLEDSDSNIITLYGVFKDYKEYTLVFVDDTTYEFETIHNIKDGDSIIWPGMDYYNKADKSHYCTGWFLENNAMVNGYTTFIESEFSKCSNANNEIYVYGNFIQKNVIIYMDEGNDWEVTKYYLTQDQIDELGVTTFSQNVQCSLPDAPKGYTYENWITEDSKTTYNPEDITINTFSEKTVILKVNKKELPYTFSISNKNTEITIKVDGKPIEESEKILYNTTVTVDVKSTYDNYKDLVVTIKNKETKETIQEIKDKTEFTFTMPACDIEISGSSAQDTCIPSGSLITLKDGSQKKVEELLDTDLVLVFNHETGKFEAAPLIFVDRDKWTYYNVINLEFSNGEKTRLIYEHGYFNNTINKYVYITEGNYLDYIGHEFTYYNGNNLERVTLVNSYITNEYVGCYSPVTAFHFNLIVDGFISMPGGMLGLFNIFEYNDDLSYNIDKMNEDIKKYGLYTYEDFKDYVPYEVYLACGGPYLKVSVEKGYITFEEILGYIEKYIGGIFVQ